jgi:DNA-directed RNA polymerase subunit RPC12/RpoP
MTLQCDRCGKDIFTGLPPELVNSLASVECLECGAVKIRERLRRFIAGPGQPKLRVISGGRDEPEPPKAA